MSEESTGVGQRTKSLVEQAKRKVGAGDPPLVTEAGGRAEGMAEAFKAFGEGDMDRFLSAFADDVEWSGPKGENFPGAGNHDGREAVRDAFIEDARRSYASFGFHPDRYLETPGENLVVALGAFKGEGVKGAAALDVPAVQVWEFDGDKVVFVGIYTDSAEFPGVVTEKEEKEREQEDSGDDGDDDEPKDRKDEDEDEDEDEDQDRDEDEDKDKDKDSDDR
jgi:ketosteroid isomerase-like protein